MADSFTDVCCQDNVLAGYSRSLNDCRFYLYVCDLLVCPRFHGQNIGRALEFPDFSFLA